MIRKLLYKFHRWVMDEGKYSNEIGASPAVADYGSRLNSESAIRLNVYPAEGGTIVEIRLLETNNYSKSPVADRYKTVVIPEGEDLAYRVGQIVAMEALRI